MKQSAFQGSAKAQPFDPVRAYDPTAAMREQSAKRLRWLQEDQQSALENHNRIGRAMAEQDSVRIRSLEQNAEKLAGFSKSLGTLAMKIQEDRRERLIEEGMAMAYEDGIPQQEVEAYKSGEQTLQQTDKAVQGAANELAEKGVPAEPIRQVRQLSGWQKLGYMRGQAANLADGFGVYLAETLPTFSANLNGREVTMEGAANQAEREIVLRELRRGYLSRFSGMNPAMLNEVAFPRMRAIEQRFMSEEAERANKLAQAEMKEERTAEVYQIFQTSQDPGTDFLSMVDRWSGGNTALIGSSRREALTVTLDLAKAGRITQQQFDALRSSQITLRDGSTTTLEDRYPAEFDAIYDALNSDAREKAGNRDFEKSEAINTIKQQIIAQNLQTPWTDGERQAVAEKWLADFGSEMPSELKNLPTVEDTRNKAQEEITQQQITLGTFTREDLLRLPPELQVKFRGAVSDTAEQLRKMPDDGKGMVRELQARVQQNLQETSTSTAASPSLEFGRREVQRLFNERFARYAQAMSPTDAASKAYQEVGQMIEEGKVKGTGPLAMNGQVVDGKFVPAIGSGNAFRNQGKATPLSATSARMAQVQEKVKSSPNAFRTQRILNESELKQAEEFFKGTPGYTIPTTAVVIAGQLKGVTPFDVLRSQMLVSGRPVPQALVPGEQIRQNIRPEFQRLLDFRPSPAKGVQAFGSSDGPSPLAPLRDVIFGVESKGSGGYDAMNTGGANGGRTAFGSADSRQVFGRGLSQMTIGEVRRLQAEGRLHATGRYQIIESTLTGLIEGRYGPTGLKDSDLYSPQNQDKLAEILILNRIDRDRNGKIDNLPAARRGLRQEWIGLEKVSDAQLDQAMNVWSQRTNGSQNFWRQPHAVQPQLFYYVSGVGPTSTGPHADGKPVIPGSLQSGRDLPSITVKSWDDFVFYKNSKGEFRPISDFGTSMGRSRKQDDAGHRARGSFGHDWPIPDGTPLFLANGARVVGAQRTEHGDRIVFEFPGGRRYAILHGRAGGISAPLLNRPS
jgi:hypothetical protein